MSEYPAEKKLDLAQLPAYPLDDSDIELVVGAPAPRRRCFWSRFRCHGQACAERKQKSPLRRGIKLFLAFLVVFGVAGFVFTKHHVKRHFKSHPIVCAPITDTTTSVELRLHSFRTHVGLHSSLTGNDVHITHSDDVEEGHVKISFTLPEDTELSTADDEAKLFVCTVAGPRYVGAGIHPSHHKKQHDEKHQRVAKVDDHKHKHHPIKATSTTITLSSAEKGKSRSINLLGWIPRHRWGHKCLKRRIRKAIAKAIKAARAEKWVKIEHTEADAAN